LVDIFGFRSLLNMKSFLKRLAPHWSPHAGQLEFLTSRARIKVLACGRRWGKTEACAVAILSELVKSKPTRHLILAPTLDQAKLLFDRVAGLLDLVADSPSPDPSPEGGGEHNPHPRPLSLQAGRGERKIRRTPYPQLTYNGHTVTARSGHLGRSLRGNEATHVIVDEAAFVPEELVTEVAMPMLATNNGRLTLISTPHGRNHFWKFFQMGLDGEHGVWSRTAPSRESTYVSKSYLEVQRQVLSERAFQIEYEAQFVDAAGTVFPTEIIDACLAPEIRINDDDVHIGIDWGRYTDYTAVAVVQGWRQSAQLLELRMFNGMNWSQMVDEAAGIVRRYPKARVLCDGTGSGDPVSEQLAREIPGHGVEVFQFTNSRKRNLIDGLKAMMERGSLKFAPDPELIRQLKYFESKVLATGTVSLNARRGFHDDLVIALALGCQGLKVQYRPKVLVGEARGRILWSKSGRGKVRGHLFALDERKESL
jgi:hypothetical protein